MVGGAIGFDLVRVWLVVVVVVVAIVIIFIFIVVGGITAGGALVIEFAAQLLIVLLVIILLTVLAAGLALASLSPLVGHRPSLLRLLPLGPGLLTLITLLTIVFTFVCSISPSLLDDIMAPVLQ